MNIVITLPVNLIAEILEGRKHFERWLGESDIFDPIIERQFGIDYNKKAVQ